MTTDRSKFLGYTIHFTTPNTLILICNSILKPNIEKMNSEKAYLLSYLNLFFFLNKYLVENYNFFYHFRILMK